MSIESCASATSSEWGPLPDDCSGPESLQHKLESLRLRVSPKLQQEINIVLDSLGDLISTRPMDLASTIDCDEEALMWSCFAEVYQSEVNLQRKRKGKEPSMNRKRQIFADILVWAEVTRPGYDTQAAMFITGPHSTDESFQRIGNLLAEAKARKGVVKV
mmetsp:Transcript_14575/g.31765  ORF Transcript_14575/g.31765 Transcript_14575/m.31765 type:complete len:160 (-) Transcript_14575:1347-1826(-)|eukprot:CAMPEP_0202890534 /NCGR_PEP_ID=MMETSP1392-20130828/899_1 /ASSEMBLY_ACC=CAM_ASM_000868 /TAXON_ID=225041 /ORGANISM="Chlamydomonas chlamydogama, Strain SAG 11-48b" /LENGTH=159 /DNA_ID=CAMNT_0049574121 /DNA_START=137 /DNA_END=616 /DNA_ORIENTATION=-